MTLSNLFEQFPQLHALSECFEVHSDSQKLPKQYPDRCHLLPMSDAALIGVALGMALDGKFPIVQLSGPEALWDILPQLHQEVGTAPQFSNGMIIRIPCNSTEIAWDLFPKSIPVWCSNNLAQSMDIICKNIQSSVPVILLESALGSSTQSTEYTKYAGEHLTLIGPNHIENVLLDIQAYWQTQNVSIEVIVLHQINQIASGITDSVYKTGRVVIVDNQPNILESIIQKAFWRLESQPSLISSTDSEPTAIHQAIQNCLE